VVAAVADEEHASLGIQQVLGQLAGTPIDAAIVGEPTELAIGTAHRGFVWTEVTVTGVAAHGSRPHLGVDANGSGSSGCMRSRHGWRAKVTTPMRWKQPSRPPGLSSCARVPIA